VKEGKRLDQGDGFRHAVYANKHSRADGTASTISRIRRVPQETKKGRSTSGSVIASGNALVVSKVPGPRVAGRGTMLDGLCKATQLIVIVVTLLALGCPVQAIVQPCGLDERMVARL
jgi:hypothetical protein